MKWRSRASASGAGSLAVTSRPRDRNVAAQLMPIVPVPTTATRRMLDCCMMRLPRSRIDERGLSLLRSGDPCRPADLSKAEPIRSLIALARAVHATRSSSRLLSRRVVDINFYRPRSREYPELFHAAGGCFLRCCGSVHLHLRFYGSLGLRPPPCQQRRALRQRAGAAAGLAALCRAHLPVRLVHRRGVLYRDRLQEPDVQ